MNIINNIRFTIGVALLTIAYLFVAVSGVVLWMGDKVSGHSFESYCDYKSLWSMYKDEIELIKQGLL